MEQPTFWIKKYECIINAYYNVHFLKNQKTMKVRCGNIFHNGKPLFDTDLEQSVRAFNYYRGSHFWVETDDGKVIDWVLNEKLGEADGSKCVWDKAEMEKLGFTYQYYKNEKGIEKKTAKSFKEVGAQDRRMRGEWNL